MIMQPDWITRRCSRGLPRQRGKSIFRHCQKCGFEPYEEGLSLQLLHIGSYDDEAPKLKQLHEKYMPEHNLEFNGRHHEIYLSDPRKTATSKLKTIVRQPVKQL